MSGMRGTCTNFGTCSKADQKLPIEVPPGAEFKCPECHLSLSPLGAGGLSSRARLLLVAAASLVVLTAGAVGLAQLFSGSDHVIVTEEFLTFDEVAEGTDVEEIEEIEEVAEPAVERAAIGATPVLPPPPPAPAQATPPPSPRPAATQAAPARPAEPPATAPAPAAPPVTIAPEPPPVAEVVTPAPPPAAPAVSIPRRAVLSATPISEICERSSRVEDTVSMRLSAPLELSDGSSVPAGTAVTGRITGKRSTGNQPPLIELEAERLMVDGRAIDLEANPVSFNMTRPSATGRVVRNAVIGGAAGAAVGLILKTNVAATAAAGAGAGAAIGAATGGPEACVSQEDTTFAFTITRAIDVR